MCFKTIVHISVFVCLLTASGSLLADEEDSEATEELDLPIEEYLIDEDTDSEVDSMDETTIISSPPPTPSLPSHRAKSEVSRENIEARLPRSSPDALRYEPGVFVQQTAHSQGSAFVRGLTGQQTLLMFDGIRLNNSTYRQGPNQYFFTLDSQTIQSIQVLRGGASTQLGSDALGGAILALPIEPVFFEDAGKGEVTWDPHIIFKTTSADSEVGGRAQSNISVGPHLAFFGGAGGRRVGLLESGGQIYSPSNGLPPRVPRFGSDNRTQLGTGFEEMTADGRLTYRISKRHQVTLAAYTYRQFDAPRTDKCPSAYAPSDECLKYDEQFRTLVYSAFSGEPDLSFLENYRLTFSWQNQHERRSMNRPSSNVRHIGRDTVDTFGIGLNARTKWKSPTSWLKLSLKYGVDSYFDLVKSDAWMTFTDIGYTSKMTRGQYVDNATCYYGGTFVEGATHFFNWLRLRAGGRFSWIGAQAEAVPEAGSRGVSSNWFPWVGNAGIEIRPFSWWHLLTNVDYSFRAPNLDDLTSRQQTGPGFQFENPNLEPETATTFEVGTRFDGPLKAEVWVFRTLIDDAVVKRPMSASDCPPETPQCQSSWTRLQLVNADSYSEIRGLEFLLAATLPRGVETRLTLAWTWGEGPNMSSPPTDPNIAFARRVPLSRVPPLNGTAEVLWKHKSGFSTGASLRWAAAQDRLALSDHSDERIPDGGTPGFAVMDFRLNYRLSDKLFASMVFENLFDTAYRYHGSSVNGPGRGVVFLLDLGPLWRL